MIILRPEIDAAQVTQLELVLAANLNAGPAFIKCVDHLHQVSFDLNSIFCTGRLGEIQLVYRIID